jgi:ABC-2 type transport system ATP-binding protein
MLQITHLKKYYEKAKALDDVSLQIGKGLVYGLLGPNGAGKSTLIRCITRIIMPDRGEIKIMGESLAQKHIQHIGYMPEERGLYKKMKVGEHLQYLARLKGLSKQDSCDKLHYWLTKFNIQSWESKNIEDLSKGMQQKIQFIAAVITRPQLLILDEPMTGLDPINADMLKDEILALCREGSTVLLSTHRMESIEMLCQEIALIHKGKIVLEGKVNEIRQQHKKNIVNITVDIVPESIAMLNPLKVEGNMLHFTIQNDKDTNEIIAKLMQMGCAIHHVEMIIPSIHEIFVDTVKLSHA